MRAKIGGCLAWAVICVHCFTTTARSDEPTSVSERREFLKETLSAYSLSVREGRTAKPISFDEQPVLRFYNPISGVVEAGVFVWNRNGYPHAVGKIFINEKKNAWGDYITSLASTRMEMRHDGEMVWLPRPQERFRRIGDFAHPAKSGVARKAQLRGIATQFQVLDLWKEDPIISDRAVTDWTLRLLAKPLVRYESEQHSVLDGAIFAFVLGTNPEVLLSIEAKTDEPEPYWQYRFARLTIYQLQAFRNSKKVWSAERILADEMSSNMPSYHGWHYFGRYPFQPSVPVPGSVAEDGLPATY